MGKKIEAKQIGKNIVISVVVQVVSLAISILINLIIPKFISEIEYAHWQTYTLYVGYVGVLHFGLLDGIVLRYSQYDYDELDKPRIRSQFKLLLSINAIFMIVLLGISQVLLDFPSKSIFSFVSFGIVTKNIFTYSSYTFQITNRISNYAKQVIAMRIFYGIMIIVFLCARVEEFYWYCIADLASDLFGVAVGYVYNKGLFFGKTISLKESFNEFAINISSGIQLLLANWSSMLLIGSAKMVIQWNWDELTFGKVSFAFSISSLFLTFVNAASVVLFPSLKRMEQDELPQMYINIRNVISPVLFFSLLLYFPGCFFLDLWLPKYHPSLIHLGVLLPIIIYTSKVSLLTNNYLKAYREEKKMLIINVISVAISFVCLAVCAILMKNLTVLLVSTVLVIMMRSIMSEIAVAKLIHIQIIKEFVVEGVMTLVFIICARLFIPSIGFTVYALFLLVYLYMNRNTILQYFSKFFKRLRG